MASTRIYISLEVSAYSPRECPPRSPHYPCHSGFKREGLRERRNTQGCEDTMCRLCSGRCHVCLRVMCCVCGITDLPFPWLSQLFAGWRMLAAQACGCLPSLGG